jgi:acetoin:2,6-dichlorophenolindophenol oxidoreductase subunit alpha
VTSTEALPSADDAVADPEELAAIYAAIALIATTDDRAAAETKSGRLQAAFYPVKGLEAVSAVLGHELDRTDQLVSTYRNTADALGKGASLTGMVQEWYGRVDGVSRGKGGPMHLHDTAVGFMASTGIVGSGMPIAVGLALGAQLDGTGRVVAVTFGDGATSIGAYHEAMNLASLWKLPVIFVCQNNGWAEHTPIDEYAPSTDLAGRAASYAMRTERVDGFDPLAVRAAVRRAIRHARSGAGPVFLECVTYRLSGHTGVTDHSYMPADVLEAAMAREPRTAFRRWLLEGRHLDEKHLAAIDEDVAQQVDAAFTAAQTGPPPPRAEANTDVYATQEVV